MRLVSIITSCLLLLGIPTYASEQQELLNVGYFEKLSYWQPVKNIRLTRSAQNIRKKIHKKIHKSGGVLIYSYDIGSNGETKNITLIKTIPENLIDKEELIKSKLIYNRFKPAEDNAKNKPVKVTERIIFQGGGLAIPPDDMTIEEYFNGSK
ncbi:hypothetical protein [Ferrimonas gelatinilytica]|uniref:TonB C-terminal domain-containing protein n=1 Tax=Ferrimonas gelatinilytica TaxID=1255257 RepID=A0ABP9RWG0_9GAMM